MLDTLLAKSLDTQPDRRLLEFHGKFWSAEELETAARRLAARLMRAGVEAIDRVAVLLPNQPETVIAYLACFKANFVIVPLDYRHQSAQIGYALNHSGADVLIVHSDRLAELQEGGVLSSVSNVIIVGGEPTSGTQQCFDDLVGKDMPVRFSDDFQPDDLCVMIYTSGTTSRPKGVTLTRSAMEEGIKKYLARIPLSGDDVALIAGPITRPMALRSMLLPILYVGGCASLIERFTPPGYIKALKREPAKTFISLLPSALGKILTLAEIGDVDFSSLRICMSGGDSVPLKVHEEFKQRTGIEITEQCGASEVGPFAVNPPFGRKKPGSIGLPMYSTQVCIINDDGEDAGTNEVGEMYVKSPLMMDGYWNDTALTRKTIKNGFIKTGDLAKYDEDCYLWFMGRRKDIIVRGGSNISPLEIETALVTHQDITSACVIGILDDEWGQVAHAFVVRHDSSTVSTDEVLEFVKGRLADYMVPEAIHFIDEMPIKGPGKIDRDLLRMRVEIGPLIEKVPFFQSVNEDFIRDIVPRLETKEFDSGETIFRQGEVGNAMYFLTRGQVDVEVRADDGGKHQTKLSEGAYFGELAVLKETSRSATICAIDECEVFELKRAGVLELAEAYPEFGTHIREAMETYS